MTDTAAAADERLDYCAYCLEHPHRTRCSYCTRRRRRAGRLADEGLAEGEIASEMGITERWAGALLADEQGVREREALRCDEIPVQIVLDVVEPWRRSAPDLNTWEELAHRVGYARADYLQRALGLCARGGQRKQTIDVGLAGQLVQAMGHLPCEFPWL